MSTQSYKKNITLQKLFTNIFVELHYSQWFFQKEHHTRVFFYFLFLKITFYAKKRAFWGILLRNPQFDIFEICNKKFEKNRTLSQRPILQKVKLNPFPKEISHKRTFWPTIFLKKGSFLDNLSPKPLSFKGILVVLLIPQRVFVVNSLM